MSCHLNKVVIVTGASSGIGAAIAVKFAAEGAKVTMVGRNVERLNNVSSKCEHSAINKPLTIICDIIEDNSAEKIINSTVEKFGKIDVLVNNAAYMGRRTSLLEENVLKLYDQVLATNLRAAVNISTLAAPYLAETKGNIINISSIAGVLPFSINFPYCTSKAGLEHFTRCVAHDLGSRGIRANCIAPGPVKTNAFINLGKGDQLNKINESLKKTTVLNRICEPEEVADLVSYVASDKAKGITGTVFLIDNGATLKGNK